MEHEKIRELLPVAALDRLEPDERLLLSAHLREGCELCERELHLIKSTLGAITCDQPVRNPKVDEKAELREERIWSRVDNKIANGEAKTNGTYKPADNAILLTNVEAVGRESSGELKWDNYSRMWRATAAIGSATLSMALQMMWASLKLWRTLFAIAIIALGVLATSFTNLQQKVDAQVQAAEQQVKALSSQLKESEAKVAEADRKSAASQEELANERRVTHALLSPDLSETRLYHYATAPNASGFIVLSYHNRSAVLDVTGLPPTPPTRNYELWWVTADKGPIKAALFPASEGKDAVVMTSMPPAGEKLLAAQVSLEPIDGSPKPTSGLYVRAEFQQASSSSSSDE